MNEVIGYNVIDIQTKVVVKFYGQGKGSDVGHYHCGWNEKRNRPMFMGSSGADIS